MDGLRLIRFVLRVLAVVFLLTIALVTHARRMHSGWIAFTSNRDGDYDLFLMTDGGEQIENIVRGENNCGLDPNWSPDGRWIAFYDRCGSRLNLLRARPGGSTLPSQIENMPNGGILWARDSSRLVVSYATSTGYDVAVVEANHTRLLASQYIATVRSNDDEWVYAVPIDSGMSRLDRIHIETGQIEQLYMIEVNILNIDASPDGSQIVLTIRGENGDSLYLMSGDGSALNAIPVELAGHRLTRPQWSPDGEWIAFLAEEPPHDFSGSYIYRVRPDGSGLQRLTQYEDGWGPLKWSPDSQWLLSNATIEGNVDIFRIRADGSVLENMTPGAGNEYSPQYAPVAGREWHPALMSLATLGMFLVQRILR